VRYHARELPAAHIVLVHLQQQKSAAAAVSGSGGLRRIAAATLEAALRVQVEVVQGLCMQKGGVCVAST